MGDRPQGAPRVQWNAYSTAALLETITQILAVLVARNEEPPVGLSVAPGRETASTPAEATSTGASFSTGAGRACRHKR